MIKLSEILYEINRYEKEMGRGLPRWKSLIQNYEHGGDFFVHFSNVPRVGLYLVNQYDTPIGFYSYPLDFDKIGDFAIERPYAIIFRIKLGAKILNFHEYHQYKFYNDLQKLKQKYSITDDQLKQWIKSSAVKSDAGYIWNITRNISFLSVDVAGGGEEKPGGGSTGSWTMILHKVLGYDGVYDDGYGIIHPDEPNQAVFFNTRIIDVVNIVDIPEGKIKEKEDFAKK